ncbi:Tyrosinase [Madurella mycetomatis]|uniref:Tyrosinase n=1 Tax=Madurella mycetomatis TaxID=100816 RepID=A0A175WC79_9PEZI|nr:Tyrosinase [Madurella mycetomatis]
MAPRPPLNQMPAYTTSEGGGEGEERHPRTLGTSSTGDAAQILQNLMLMIALFWPQGARQRFEEAARGYIFWPLSATKFNKPLWNQWANTVRTSTESLESLHDTIHFLSGGFDGHLSFPTYDGRLFTRSHSRTALTPFFSDNNGTFWTSDGVRDHTELGYTYVELVSGPAATSEETRASVRRAVNRLYGMGKPAVPPSLSARRYSGVVTTAHERTAYIRVEKHASDGRFATYLFLAPPPNDTRDWMPFPKHVGIMGVWTAGGQDVGTTRLQPADGLFVAETVPLTAALMQKITEGELESLEPEDVECSLKIRLEKRVMGFAGQVWDADQVRGLRVQIVNSVVRAPSCEEQLPVRGSRTVILMCNEAALSGRGANRCGVAGATT